MTSQNELMWSKSEKAIARTAFDAALSRELHEVIQKAKRMANEIQQAEDLWQLERFLTQRGKEIDGKYEYRYSELMQVLGRLLQERRLSEEELHGLQPDKLKAIHSYAKLLEKEAA
jgi:hypothetical protein